MTSLLAAFGFLTAIPIPEKWTGERDLARAVWYFPVVGLLVGLLAAGLMILSLQIWPASVGCSLVILLLGGVSKWLHLDGLADTADGFLSSRPRERKLEIMRDSRTGAMGVMAIVSVLLLKYAGLTAVARSQLPVVVFLMPLAGRTSLVLSMAMLPYARRNGLAAVFAGRNLWTAAVLSTGVYALGACWFTGLVGMCALVGGWFALILGFSLICRRLIGGMTGDTLGAICELSEVMPLLLLSSGL